MSMESEIIQNPFYHYTYVFDKNTGDLEYPDVYLLTKSLHKKGQLYPVSGLKIVVKANDTDEISFDFYKYLDNIEQELYDKLKTDSVVYVKGFGCFQLKVNEYDKEEGIYKSVSGESLANIELSNILVTLEVNNENDVLVSDYENESVTDYMPTVFYREPKIYEEYSWSNSKLTDEEKKNKIMQSSLLHRVLSYAPHYQIGHIDKTLFYVQRTFSWTNAYLNDVLNDIAQEVGCIFTFETYLDDNGDTVRKINAYDVSYCTRCYNDSSILLSYKSYDTSKFRSITNGVCDNCGSSEFVYDYGSDTDIFITTENLTDGISLQSDGEIKNVFKITGGDDLITNTVQAVNMGSNKIMMFSEDTKSEMPTDLREKLNNYFNDQEKYKPEYESLIETQYNVIDLIQYLQSGKMPQPIDENKDIQEEVKYLINSIRTYYDNDFYIESYDKGERCYLGHKETVSASMIRNMFTLFLDRGYSIRVTNGELADEKQSSSDYFIRWNGIVKIYETSNSDNYAEIHCSSNDTTYVEYNEIFSEGSKLQETYPYFTIRLAFGDENTTHYSKYIEQFCNQKLASYKQVEYKNEEQKPWKEYCYERLKSYSDGYQACLESLNELELQQSIDSLKSIIYSMMSNYSSIKSNIDSQMSLLVKQINALYRYWGNYTYEIDKYGNKTYSPDYVSEDFNVDYVSVLQDMADKTSSSYVGNKPIACGKCGSSNVSTATDTSGIQYNYCKSCGDTDSIITYGDIAKQVADKCKTASNSLIKDIDKVVKFFKIENYFGEYYNELLPYIKEQEYSNSNYTSDACNTNQDIIAKAKELLKKARKELSKACVLQLSLNTDAFSILAERWKNWDKNIRYHDMYNMFSLGNWMRSRLDKTIYKLRLISITFDFDSVDKLSIEFSNVTRNNNGVLSDIDSLLKQTSSISSTYDYVTEQAEKGSEANVVINNILKMGYDSALAAVMAGDNQEITMDRHGLLFRKYLDEVDDYSRFQMKMINRNIVMSDDGFRTAKLAIGLGVLPDGSLGYGIWADNIIGGNIVCTNNLKIIGGKSSVVIDGNGIHFEKGTIESEAIDGLDDYLDGLDEYKREINKFKIKVEDSLNFTKIGSDYVISPKIGGGYLYIAKENGCSVEIDPLGLKNGNVLRIADKYNDIMVVDSDGNGTFKGKITSNDAEITGGSITVTGVHSNKDTTTYIGSGYIEVYGNDQGVNRSIELYNGALWAKDTTSNKKLTFQNENFEMDLNGKAVFRANTKEEKFDINFKEGHINFGCDSNGENPSLHIGTSDLRVGRYAPLNNYFYIDSQKFQYCWIDANNNYSINHSINDNEVNFCSNNLGKMSYKNSEVVSQWYGSNNYQPKTSSDFRLKKDILSLPDITQFYLSLKPKSYTFKDTKVENNNKIHYGLLAQETKKALDENKLDSEQSDLIEEYECRDYMDEGQYTGKTAYRINYENLHAFHISFSQGMYKEIQILKEENNKKDQEIALLKERLDKLESIILKVAD